MFKGGRIIDIALDYGFETHNGFSKAFKKEFGFSPKQYVKCMGNYFNEELNIDFGGYIMNPVIIKNLHSKLQVMELKLILQTVIILKI